MCVWIHRFLFWSLHYKLISLTLITPCFVAQILALATGNSFRLLPAPFQHDRSFLHLISFSPARCARFILYFSFPRPRISHVSKKLWLPFVGITAKFYSNSENNVFMWILQSVSIGLCQIFLMVSEPHLFTHQT